jgi:hypothetical protein
MVMTRLMNRFVFGAALAAAAWTLSAAKADAATLLSGGFNPAFNFATNWIPNSTVGALITVGASDLSVTGLGFGDFGQDGFVVSHQVGIWSTDAGNPLLGSVTLAAGTGDPLTGEWRFTDLGAPIVLSANTQYFIGATTNIGIADTMGGTVNDGDNWFGSGNAGIQPDFVYSSDFTGTPGGFKGDDGGGFNVPLNGLGVQVYSLNLEYAAVPEPAMMSILGLASLAALGGRRRATR